MKDSTVVNKALEEFIDSMCLEVDYAIDKHGDQTPLHCRMIDFKGILQEEVNEVFDEISPSWKSESDTLEFLPDVENFKKELSQVACVCLMMYSRILKAQGESDA